MMFNIRWLWIGGLLFLLTACATPTPQPVTRVPLTPTHIPEATRTVKPSETPTPWVTPTGLPTKIAVRVATAVAEPSDTPVHPPTFTPTTQVQTLSAIPTSGTQTPTPGDTSAWRKTGEFNFYDTEGKEHHYGPQTPGNVRPLRQRDGQARIDDVMVAVRIASLTGNVATVSTGVGCVDILELETLAKSEGMVCDWTPVLTLPDTFTVYPSYLVDNKTLAGHPNDLALGDLVTVMFSLEEVIAHAPNPQVKAVLAYSLPVP